MKRQHTLTRLLRRRTFMQGAGVAGLGLLAGCGRLLGPRHDSRQDPVSIGTRWLSASAALAAAVRVKEGAR